MNLQIAGKNAIVCASSRGLGKGCAISLAREGANVVINGRCAETLEATLAEVRAVADGEVSAVRCDVTTDDGRAQLLAACPAPDILVNNAGGPPPGDFREWDEAHWSAAVNANMFTPIALIKATLDGMIERGFGRIVNITSAAVKAPIAVLGLSNGARAGLTGFIAGLARQTGRGVTINNLLPGPHQTDRLRANYRFQAERKKVDFDTLYNQAMQANPTGRFGDAQEFGDLCAYLCSAQAGYVNGQNILIDGGAFPGTL
ncbi:MAG: SDR family oxidoreductase [bacterium]